MSPLIKNNNSTTKSQVKALPLNFSSSSSPPNRTLSLSQIQPSDLLFTLKISTLPPYPNSRLYQITIAESNQLITKSALFRDLQTQYNSLASSSFNESVLSSSSQDEEIRGLLEESAGLPMLMISSPVQNPSLIDSMLDFLSSPFEPSKILNTSLAKKIVSISDFFSLIHFSTLLDLYEPYSTAVDEILVYFYFGLTQEERKEGIILHDQFVEGILPGRFVSRLTESVCDQEAKEIVASFFRASFVDVDEHVIRDDKWFDVYLKDEERRKIESGGLLFNKGGIYHKDNGVNEGKEEKMEPLFSPFDYAEPPTPLGSAYMCIPPPTPTTPGFQKILPRSSVYAHNPTTPVIKNMKRPRPLSTPPPSKTPRADNFDPISPILTTRVPPNTPFLPDKREMYLKTPPPTPCTPTIIVNDSTTTMQLSENAFRRELFEVALNKMRASGYL